MRTDHGCRLPRLRWIGREWRCRCGQEWCYITRKDDRFWARWHSFAGPTTEGETPRT